MIRRKRNNFLNQVSYQPGGQTTGGKPPIITEFTTLAEQEIKDKEAAEAAEAAEAKEAATIFGMKPLTAAIIGLAVVGGTFFLVRRRK